MTELIPKALHLHDGPMKAVAKQFTKHFRQAWKRFPPRAQGVITDYLRDHRGTAYLCFRMDHDDQGAWSRCMYHGEGHTSITFLAPYFVLTTNPEHRVLVIAHELAHIYRRGTREWTTDNQVEEEATRAQGVAWGSKFRGCAIKPTKRK